jgi:hypothetical protein
MNEFVRRIKPYLPIIALLVVLIPLGLYAYLGTFSRYGSDDYCLSAFFHQPTDFWTNMVRRYNHSSSRYTNILFIGLVDAVFGWRNTAILPPLMLFLFLFGFYFFLNQIQSTARLGWSRWLTFYLAALITFFSMVQSPNVYETLYWRAGMTSHFAPVAFIPFLGAFVMRQIRLASERKPPVWVYASCFVIPFVIGGLSEPPTTLMITILVLAIAAVWWWVKTPARNSILSILAWTLAGATAALIVLALAPANALRLGQTTTNVFRLTWNIFYRTFEFLFLSLKTLPLPIFFSVTIPGLLFFVKHADQAEEVRNNKRRVLKRLLPIVWLVSYLLIAASFAPSVYGQGFPAERARFAGVVVLTCTFMVTGALLGILVAERGITVSRLTVAATVAFIIVSLYPLRTAWRLSTEVPLYQDRAAAWDRRDAKIRALKDEGVRDLTVRFLDGEILQDLDDRTKFRLNRCASTLYGVNTIIAVPMDE